MIQNNSKGQLTAQVNLGENVRSGFRFDYANRGTGRLGRIYNTRAQHVYPSDNVTSNTIAALQFEPLAVPILANMFVHQEHFYVPENTLWDDFDKFISGGVNMDYKGKKPSMSLQDMFRAFFDILSNQQEGHFLNPIYLKRLNQYELGLDYFSISRMIDYEMSFKPLLEQYQLLDLFEYMEDVIHDMGNYFDTIYNSDTNAEIKLFTTAKAISSGSTTETDFTYFYNDLQPNKYLRKIYKSVITAYDAANNGNGAQYIIPTPEGMQFLNYLYEIIKPFFGYSSYLDMLGYNKLTFDNFVYVFILSLLDSFIMPFEYEVGDQIMLDDFFATLPINMSEYPQDILKLRAQYSVWWNNYRDQLLENDAPEPKTVTTISDLELLVLLAPRVRCWHKDTFTTSLDNPGTGDVGVPVGLTNSANTEYRGLIQNVPFNDGVMQEPTPNGDNIFEIQFNGKSWKLPTAYLSGINEKEEGTTSSGEGFSLYQLDAAKRAQKWLQRALFFGNRIQDFLFTHFGVKYLDARLRLPELLATSRELVRLTDVINNTNVKSEDNTIAVAGDRAAIAHAYDENGGSFQRYIEEHGYIISNLTVMPDVTYANGFARDLAMLDQFDYPFPEFATLGMDAVYDIELAQLPVKVQDFYNPEVSAEPRVFGYQGRYYDVKSKLSEEHGELLDTQDMYTFARDFNIYDIDKRPKLNYIFVHCYPVLDMFVVDNKYSDYFRFDMYFNSGANRPFPAHSLVI